MNESTPKPLVDQAILLWLSGLTGQEIRIITGVSTGRVSEITQEYQLQVPDANTIRALSKRLREHDPNLQSNVPYVLRALSTQMRLDDLGIGQVLIDVALRLIQSQGSSEEAEAKIRAGLKLARVEAETRMPYTQLIAKASDARTLLSEKEARIAELESKEAALLQRIGNLEQLEILQQCFHENGIDSIEKVANFLQVHLELEQNGFTSHVARNLASVLASIGLTPQEAAVELASLLAGGMDLKASVATLKRESERLEKENARQVQYNTQLKDDQQRLQELKNKLSIKVKELYNQAEASQEQISYAKALDVLMNDPTAIKDEELAEVASHLVNVRTQRHQGNVARKISDVELKIAKSLLLKHTVKLLKNELAPREELTALEQKFAQLKLEKERIDAENKELRTHLTDAEVGRDTAVEATNALIASLFPSNGMRGIPGYRCQNLGIDIAVNIDRKRMNSLMRRGYFVLDCQCHERHRITVADLFHSLRESGGVIARVSD